MKYFLLIIDDHSQFLAYIGLKSIILSNPARYLFVNKIVILALKNAKVLVYAIEYTYIHALKTCNRHASLFTCSYVSTRVCISTAWHSTHTYVHRWVFVLFIYIKVHLFLSNSSFVWINGPLRRALAKNRHRRLAYRVKWWQLIKQWRKHATLLHCCVTVLE